MVSVMFPNDRLFVTLFVRDPGGEGVRRESG
jgi:hypothetical protein